MTCDEGWKGWMEVWGGWVYKIKKELFRKRN